jgi:hypothetical protein
MHIMSEEGSASGDRQASEKSGWSHEWAQVERALELLADAVSVMQNKKIHEGEP